MHRNKMIGLAFAGALAVGCGGGTNGNNHDLRTANPDLSMPDLMTPPPPPDLTTPPDMMEPPPDMLCPGGKTTTVMVGMGGNNFNPATVTINKCDTIRWVWAGAGMHTVTSGTAPTPDNKFCDDNNMDCANAPLQGSGHTYSFTFTTAGTYPYFCRPHSGVMKGTITVN